MRPFVNVYAEVSADGKSTHRRGASSIPMMAFEEDAIRRHRHELRARSEAIIVGSTTIRLDDPQLTARYVTGASPLRVVTSSRADIPLTARVLTDGGRTLVAVSAAAPESSIEALKSSGVDVVALGDARVDLARLLEHLNVVGVRSLVVEGGATLLSSFFRGGLVDRLIVQHLPVVFGGDCTPAMVGGPPMASIEDAIPLRLIDVQRIGSHAVITYERGR